MVFLIHTIYTLFTTEFHYPSELTFEASPYGKKFPYIFLNSSTLKWPLGQSFRNPLYHSWISASRTKVIKWQQFLVITLKKQIRWDWPTCQFQFFRQKLNNCKKYIFKFTSLEQFRIKRRKEGHTEILKEYIYIYIYIYTHTHTYIHKIHYLKTQCSVSDLLKLLVSICCFAYPFF